MTIAFIFIASFYILCVCWFTPFAGTDEINNNQTKAVSVITIISMLIAAGAAFV